MSSQSVVTVSPQTRAAEKTICKEIKDAEVMLKKDYPILNYQDLMGSMIFLTSLAGIAVCCQFYFAHKGNPIVTVAVMTLIAVFTSLLHELEHDLIHNLYWRKLPIIQNVMFFCIWVMKLHSNPWYRRDMHLKHHIVSGQIDDAEERLIGLGLPAGFRRMVATVHPFVALMLTKEVSKDAKWLDVQKMNLTSAPVAFIFFFLTKAFMVYMLAIYFFPNSFAKYLPMQYWETIYDLNVLFCIPNLFRTVCLVLMSNCSHYYGDIPEKSVFYQNQILDHWSLLPLQLFCFNFGATHIVHHYVPGQAFYVRQLVFGRVKDHMVSLGVRNNDFGIVTRSNRYFVFDSSQVSSKVQSSSDSGLGNWIVFCSGLGFILYGFIDQVVALSLASRIMAKYLYNQEYFGKEK